MLSTKGYIIWVLLFLFASAFAYYARHYGRTQYMLYTSDDRTGPRSTPGSTPASGFTSNEVHRFNSGWYDFKDPRFLEYVRNRWIIEPSLLGYNTHQSWTKQKDLSQFQETSFVDTALGQKRNGFFVECGAADGTTYSNSIFFERVRGWTGLLIEANPDMFKRLLIKRRKAHSINVCLGMNNVTEQVRFISNQFIGGIETGLDERMKLIPNNPHTHMVQCFPFTAIIQALGVTRIDYFSLDVEGPELEILKTIPFNAIYVDLFTVEYRVTFQKNGKMNSDIEKSLHKLRKIREFFRSTGLYKEVGIIPVKPSDPINKIKPDEGGIDVVFQRK